MRVHMHMFVEQLTSRDPVRTRLGKQLLSVDEFYPRAPLPSPPSE